MREKCEGENRRENGTWGGGREKERGCVCVGGGGGVRGRHERDVKNRRENGIWGGWERRGREGGKLLITIPCLKQTL